MGQTVKFNFMKPNSEDIKKMIKEVYDALVEKGYNPTSQMVGYLLSGDPTYVTSHNDARGKIRQYERDEVLEILLNSFIEKEIVND